MPQHYEWLEIFEIISDWYDGNSDKNSTYFTIRFLWWDRIGNILQFIAGLSILVEIIGKERMSLAMKDIENSINLKKLIALVKKAFDFSDEIYNINVYQIMVIFSVSIFRLIPKKKDAFQSFFSDIPSLFGSLAPMMVFILIFWKAPILVRKIFFFPIILFLQIFQVISLIVVEIIFLKPAIFYMKISQKDKQLKVFSFFVFLLGFALSFLFS